MNARSIVLVGAVALLGAGLLMTILQSLKPPPPATRIDTAVAAVQIEPYTVVTEGMVKAGESMRERDVVKDAIWPADQVIGLMTTKRIAPGDIFNAENLKPIEEVRYTEDLNLELVSFAASVDRLLGGDLRPGHIINLYGFTQGGAEESITQLIEPNLWVVKVSSSGQAVSKATPVYNPDTGQMEAEGSTDTRPVTLVTVATTPDRAFKIIDALGAKRLSAWVTLAANQTASSVMATPAPVLPTPTTGLPLDLSLTATAIANALAATAPPPPPKTGGGGTR